MQMRERKFRDLSGGCSRGRRRVMAHNAVTFDTATKDVLVQGPREGAIRSTYRRHCSGAIFGLHLIRGAGCCKVTPTGRGAYIVVASENGRVLAAVGYSVASVLDIPSACSWKFEK